MEEGTFTGAGTDSLAPRFATEHVASRWEPPHRSRWQRFLAWLGLSDA